MMTTESPVRMVESGGGATNWQPSKGVATFTSQLHNMAADELEVLLNTQRYPRGQQRKTGPNRSGSAPPSIEGSFAAYSNLIAQQTSNIKSSIPGFGNSLEENSESEEQMRADPAYIAYYYSNVNLNPRLPPPLTKSGVNRGNSGGGAGNNWRLSSHDDSGEASLHFARNSLSPHNEEPEDDKSDNCSDTDNIIVTTGYDASSLDAHHKSLVDLIQEDFPRTPSPLYNLSHSSNHATTVEEEGIAHDIQSISLENLFLNATKLSDSNSDSINAHVKMNTEGENQYGSSPNTIADAHGYLQDIQSRNENNGRLLTSATKPDALTFQQPQSHVSFSHPGVAYQVQQQLATEGMSSLLQGTEGASIQSKICPPAEVSQQQHFVQPPGLAAPPLYATAAAYMTTCGNLPPYYPAGSHLSSASMYAAAPPPQYGGYNLSSAFVPPFIAGYSTGGVHVQYDPTAAATTPATSFSPGEAFPHTAGDLLQQQQHVNKFYGGQQHRGLSPLQMQMQMQMQPSFPDPLQMQYFKQQSVGQDAYGAQHGWLSSMSAFGGQDGYASFSSEKQASIASYRGSSSSGTDQMFLSENVRRSSGSYYGNAPPLTQFRASPFGSPILPASPVAAVGSNTPGRRNELWLGQRGSGRNSGIYDTGWQGQRGVDSLSDSQKKHSILDELKLSTARKIELSDISGRIIEFSIDQHGSRFIQQKLENCKIEERESVFREVLPHAPKLMTDVFGNYVIQKFFEHGSPEQRKQLADQLSGQILPLTLQMYGCRVIQKALEVIEHDQKTELVSELDGHVLRCVRDQNGNHVIQKCIESIPTEKIGFIITSFKGQVATLSTHPYGCRVIQRVLEHCGDELQSQCIVDEILESAHILALDQYGNYVTQHVLQRGKPPERSQIISKLSGRVVQMSQHKYASNVVEKCLEYGDVAERERLIEEILGQSEENNNLLTMMKDQFANYVVQKMLEISNDKQREVLLHRINVNLQALRKYTYGKHIVARFEQLCGEEADGSGS